MASPANLEHDHSDSQMQAKNSRPLCLPTCVAIPKLRLSSARLFYRLTLAALALAVSGCAAAPQTIVTGKPLAHPPLGLIAKKDLARFDALPPVIERKLNYTRKQSRPGNILFDSSEIGHIKEILDTHFVYRTDKDLYGRFEDWRPPVDMTMKGELFYGDCDDYALMARAMLRKRGIPSRLVFVYQPVKGGHLIVESGGWILYNATRRVTTLDALAAKGYTFKSISGFDLHEKWVDATSNNAPNSGSLVSVIVLPLLRRREAGGE